MTDPDPPAGDEPPKGESSAPDAHGPARPATLWSELRRLERLVSPGVDLLQDAEERFVVPAWRRVTQGEPRWPVSLAILVAIALQVALPARFFPHARFVLPGLEVLLLIGIVAANPRRIDHESPVLRGATLILIAIVSSANGWAAARLVHGLVQGTEGEAPGPLLLTGASIWLTNVVVFTLWYWDLDRGGPVARAHGARSHPDFLFAQMQSPELAPPEWEPGFVDYLYLSFTNATAFSPTDVLPLSRWAKMTMMVQSAVSLTTVALVIARAVNILK